MANVKISALNTTSAVASSDVLPIVHEGSTRKVTVGTLVGGKEDKASEVTGTGSVSVTLADNKEYNYTAVTSLTMTGTAVDAHGFITFGSNPTISVSGFDASSGDDITGAGSGEVWEFSCMEHNSKSYIVWKKWA